MTIESRTQMAGIGRAGRDAVRISDIVRVGSAERIGPVRYGARKVWLQLRREGPASRAARSSRWCEVRASSACAVAAIGVQPG